MDTIQVTPLAITQALPQGELASLAPLSKQGLTGGELLQVEFTEALREASERAIAADSPMDNLLLPPPQPSTSPLKVSVNKNEDSGNFSPLEGQGLAAQSSAQRGSYAARSSLFIGMSEDVFSLPGGYVSLQPIAPRPVAPQPLTPQPSNQLAGHIENQSLMQGSEIPDGDIPDLVLSDISRSNSSAGRVFESPVSVPMFRVEAQGSGALPLDSQPASVETGGVSVEPSLAAVSGALPTSPLSTTASIPPVQAANLVLQAGEPLLDGLGEKIIWLTRQENPQATLHLRPAELGALEVRVSISNTSSAHIEIHAQQSDTGDLIESMLPKLQQALEHQGIKLDEVKMSQQSLFADNRTSQQQSNSRDSSHAGPSSSNQGDHDASAEDDSVMLAGVIKESAIDTYA